MAQWAAAETQRNRMVQNQFRMPRCSTRNEQKYPTSSAIFVLVIPGGEAGGGGVETGELPEVFLGVELGNGARFGDVVPGNARGEFFAPLLAVAAAFVLDAFADYQVGAVAGVPFHFDDAKGALSDVGDSFSLRESFRCGDSFDHFVEAGRFARVGVRDGGVDVVDLFTGDDAWFVLSFRHGIGKKVFFRVKGYVPTLLTFLSPV